MDPHERPPDAIRTLYKSYQKMQLASVDGDALVLDFRRELSDYHKHYVKEVQMSETPRFTEAFERFVQFPGTDKHTTPALIEANDMHPVQYQHDLVPGLVMIPSLLPPVVQRELLSRILHRDLSEPSHNTNIHLHYNLKYPPSTSSSRCPASFFSLAPSAAISYQPKGPNHSPLDHGPFLARKLRWLTLGGQYDWTLKQYPATAAPPIPADLAALVQALLPTISPEAAIANVYSPGDTLSVHRDVSEGSSAGLVSLSLGCDGIFVIAGGEGKACAIRLRSGDAIFMTGRARFAWHGLPRVVANTCPPWLADWPAISGDAGSDGRTDDGPYERWKGWMAGKRINLNVRQMWD